jgi:hypothetical protein
MIRSITIKLLDRLIPNRCYNHEADKILLGKLLINQNNNKNAVDYFSEIEFKIFSQFGEDGIIQWIINKLQITNKSFIEFGVGNYLESNTRFLLENNNWKGFIIDGDKKNIEFIKKNAIYWEYDLTAECAFITRENINDLFLDHGFQGDIGLLSIDIDGNDFWIWEVIDVISPQIVICEYNSVFGDTYAITVPYHPEFNLTRAHYSNLYWGVSLPALCILAETKGYDFIGSNSAGNNAFFIRKDCSGPFQKISAKQGYVRSNYRESLDQSGNLTYVSGNERLKVIEEMEVYDIQSKTVKKISDLTRSPESSR